MAGVAAPISGERTCQARLSHDDAPTSHRGSQFYTTKLHSNTCTDMTGAVCYKCVNPCGPGRLLRWEMFTPSRVTGSVYEASCLVTLHEPVAAEWDATVLAAGGHSGTHGCGGLL